MWVGLDNFAHSRYSNGATVRGFLSSAARGEVFVVGCSCVVISRQHAAEGECASLEDDLARLLAESGRSVIVTPHLYHLPHGSDLWREIARIDGDVAVMGWLSPRALECLLREYADLEAAVAVDLREVADISDALAAVGDPPGPAEGAGEVRELHAETEDRWYPLIDRTRCISCRHCLQFCLFGVYSDGEQGEVVAVSPDSCKDGCPACARVCPEGAIVFPLCDEAAIAGAPGTIMEPDAAARRMYYVRTGTPCPECGEILEPGDVAQASEDADTCAECGRPLAEVASEPSPVHEEIDSLIDALDDLAAGGGSE